jgi:putative endonuclease
MFYVYIIKSESSGKTYIGQTSDLEKRLGQHNDPDNNFSRYTKQNKGPWKLVYKEEVATRLEALNARSF